MFTTDEANRLAKNVTGQSCKNLFVRNGKGDKHYLIILLASKKVDLKNLSKQINSTRLSFASKERLNKYLGLKPGAVSPFGLINNSEKNVEVLLDKDFIRSESIGFHPNINTATITISYEDFEKFLEWCGNKFSYVHI